MWFVPFRKRVGVLERQPEPPFPSFESEFENCLPHAIFLWRRALLVRFPVIGISFRAARLLRSRWPRRGAPRGCARPPCPAFSPRLPASAPPRHSERPRRRELFTELLAARWAAHARTAPTSAHARARPRARLVVPPDASFPGLRHLLQPLGEGGDGLEERCHESSTAAAPQFSWLFANGGSAPSPLCTLPHRPARYAPARPSTASPGGAPAKSTMHSTATAPQLPPLHIPSAKPPLGRRVHSLCAPPVSRLALHK